MRAHAPLIRSVIVTKWSNTMLKRKLRRLSNQKRHLTLRIRPNQRLRILRIRLHPKNLQKKNLLKKLLRPLVRLHQRALKKMQRANLRTRSLLKEPKLLKPQQKAPSLNQQEKILKNQPVRKKRRLLQLRDKRRKVLLKPKLLILYQ